MLFRPRSLAIRNSQNEGVQYNGYAWQFLEFSDDHAAKGLIKFQKILNIPAVQLVNKSGICKLVSNNNLKIMIISADHWLSLLP
jgi:hypothetical protein